MMRILVTGSADGLGRAAADSLLSGGHDVVVHARNEDRAASLAALVDRGADIVVGDFTDRDAVRRIAVELNGRDPLDAVIHNAGVWRGRAVMPVNVIAPYLLTALLDGPRRHVYLSSGSHFGGRPSLAGIDWQGTAPGSYADSKLFVTTLAAAVARLRPELISNAVDPGWVPTKMGGPGAPDDLDLGHQTQEWLAASDEPQALTSGGYWYHQQRRQPHRAVHDHTFQEQLLEALAGETGTRL
ncbi:SDR family NAD(P)-dependent oxidoreductase [Arthrobacter sp. OVS8]|nr:SDR family NAD(P)-dependent oxidoreductase [Arthrobacter sp. OVS8]